MCGRYRRTTREEELARIYRIPIPSQPDLPISYNIAPSQEVLAIRFNPETKQRSLDRLRWGLVPYWAKDEKIGFKAINALNLPRFDGHGNSKKERGPDGSKKERATGLYGAIQKPSSGDGDPQRQEFGADCARAWV